MNRRVLGCLQDSGLVASVTELKEELGINPDEEEAKEIEAGEFCRLNGRIKAQPKQIQKVAAVKRADSDSQQESGPKKKKGKKA